MVGKDFEIILIIFVNDLGDVCATDRPITIMGQQVYMTRSLYDRLSGNNGYRLTMNSAAIAGLVSVLVNNLNITAVNVVEVFNAVTGIFSMSRAVEMEFSNQLTDAVTGLWICPEIGDGQGLIFGEMLKVLAIGLTPYVVLAGIVTIGTGVNAVVTTIAAWRAAQAAAALVLTTINAANAVANHFGAQIINLNNGFSITVGMYGKKPIIVRIMNSGSGGRVMHYFRVSIDGLGSLTLNGIISADRALTHIDLGPDFLNQIIQMVRTFLESR